MPKISKENDTSTFKENQGKKKLLIHTQIIREDIATSQQIHIPQDRNNGFMYQRILMLAQLSLKVTIHLWKPIRVNFHKRLILDG